MKKDFEFLSGLVNEFFARKAIKDSLSVISKSGMTGWEKWLQIEFAKFCDAHDDVAEWYREQRYELDKRLSKDKAICAVDFWIRQKYKQSPLGVEIKQHPSASGCIKSMVGDVAKIHQIKYSQDDLRGIWCIGVHGEKPVDAVKRLVVYHADERGIGIDTSLVFTKQIGRTGFSVTLL
ncbi:MAG: hypothetical protein LDL19_02040 [Thiobacillus sp.]|nr:hypothetical protein [Thiobacillus sp.]